ncbi:MAG TPA: Ig-like domain-containing protein, partial [Acidimicrobiia bacterium]|nr:Ig-like domain-containing protein [Acidimicrobiia bacterium]
GQPIVGMVPTVPVRRLAAVDDVVVMPEDTSVDIAVLGNDDGVGDSGDISELSIVSPAAHGTATVGSGGHISYAPDANYAGPDALTYRVVRADGGTSEATVQIVVTAVNDAPVAADVSVSTTSGVIAAGLVEASDLEGDTLAYSLGEAAGHGTVEIDPAGGFTYTPEAGYAGPDRFVVGVDDGHGGAATSVVTVTVVAADDLPVAVPDAATTPEDTAVVIDVTANDTGLADGGIVVTVDPAALDPATEGAVVVAGGSLTFTPAADVNGTVAFDYTVTDADGDRHSAAVTVTVTPVSDPPTITAIGAVSVPLGTRDAQVVAFTVADVDDPAGSLTVTATSSDQSVLPDANLSLVPVGPDGSWTLALTPVHRVEGTSTITVAVSDGVNTAQTMFSFTVTPR